MYDRFGRPHGDQPAIQDAGMLLLRVFAGLSLALAHGVGKLPPPDRFIGDVAEMGFPLPLLFAWAAALSESVGGVLLAIGLLTRPAALFILITMLVASFIRLAGAPYGDLELSLLYGAVAAMFLLAGAGRFSIDSAMGRRFGMGRPGGLGGRR